jgi:SagB-type dehydrogenase family enzyme
LAEAGGTTTRIALATLVLLAAGCGTRDAATGADAGATRDHAAREDAGPAAPAPDDGAPIELRPVGLTRLPPPRLDLEATLMTALSKRRSTRAFDAARPLGAQVVSDLLWAAAGVNRPDEGKRTAPSARDRQEIDVYATFASGAFKYLPREHALEPAATGDLRALTGTQDYVATAPLDLVFVADLARMLGNSEQDQLVTSAADTGFIAQNVYLFCAAEGLGTVVRGSIDREPLAKALSLRPAQRIVLAQTVGYPSP